VIGIKEYEILYDTGEARKLVAQINRMAREGWKEVDRRFGKSCWLACCLRFDGARSWLRASFLPM